MNGTHIGISPLDNEGISTSSDNHKYLYLENPIKQENKVSGGFKKRFFRPEVIPFDLETERVKGKGFHYKGQEYIHHSSLGSGQIALHRFSGKQIIGLWIFVFC